MNIKDRKDEESAVFYDAWYERGYMDEWPCEKKQRVFEIIKSLNLPQTGETLDLGCGNGEFTGVLKKALPGWHVYGTDISAVAVDNARKRHPDCSFFILSEAYSVQKKFDFLFSHHTLEHVVDIDRLWNEINRYLNRQAAMLHILPCGNQGSFEYNLCLLKKNGIEKDAGNRFYFEDKSHLRRLSTKQMNDFALRCNFRFVNAFYSNQLHGALDWITMESIGFIWQMTCPNNAKDKPSALTLLFYRLLLLTIKCLRVPANTIDYKKDKMKVHEYYAWFLLLLVLYPFSKLTNCYLRYRSDREWMNKKSRENGSEMYVYYARN